MFTVHVVTISTRSRFGRVRYPTPRCRSAGSSRSLNSVRFTSWNRSSPRLAFTTRRAAVTTAEFSTAARARLSTTWNVCVATVPVSEHGFVADSPGRSSSAGRVAGHDTVSDANCSAPPAISVSPSRPSRSVARPACTRAYTVPRCWYAGGAPSCTDVPAFAFSVIATTDALSPITGIAPSVTSTVRLNSVSDGTDRNGCPPLIVAFCIVVNVPFGSTQLDVHVGADGGFVVNPRVSSISCRTVCVVTVTAGVAAMPAGTAATLSPYTPSAPVHATESHVARPRASVADAAPPVNRSGNGSDADGVGATRQNTSASLPTSVGPRATFGTPLVNPSADHASGSPSTADTDTPVRAGPGPRISIARDCTAYIGNATSGPNRSCDAATTVCTGPDTTVFSPAAAMRTRTPCVSPSAAVEFVNTTAKRNAPPTAVTVCRAAAAMLPFANAAVVVDVAFTFTPVSVGTGCDVAAFTTDSVSAVASSCESPRHCVPAAVCITA